MREYNRTEEEALRRIRATRRQVHKSQRPSAEAVVLAQPAHAPSGQALDRLTPVLTITLYCAEGGKNQCKLQPMNKNPPQEG
jgi:hypothetical protein